MYSPPPSAEVKNACVYTSTPQYVFMAWCLVKHRGNFTFILPSAISVWWFCELLWQNKRKLSQDPEILCGKRSTNICSFFKIILQEVKVTPVL